MPKYAIALSALLIAVGTAAVFGIFQYASEQNRFAAIEKRDKWISDTVSEVAAGQTHVVLYSCINTDFMLESLAGMEHLESISFQQTIDLTDEGLQHLTKMPNLKELSFCGESISNDSIRILTKCTCLTSLSLELTRVSDAGLESIAKIPQLRSFDHFGQFSEEAIESLSARAPDLEITNRAVVYD